MVKITKTYSVDQKLYEVFDQLTEEKNINKSSFIEGCINRYIEENDINYIDKIYVLKTDSNYGVKIKRKDDTFYYLNDGSKIPIILFMQMYKEVEQVDPVEFFNNKNITKNYEFIKNSLSKTGYEDLDKINS